MVSKLLLKFISYVECDKQSDDFMIVKNYVLTIISMFLRG